MLNPETITVIDPACGSGHILVEAYEVLKAIYLERGYQLRSIPRLILEKNLYGLDIDDRAAQLAGFALLMKARADDRRLLDNPPKLNVLSLQESKGLDADELILALSAYAALSRPAITSLIDTFAHAKTFGSLIQIPPDLNAEMATINISLQLAIKSGDLLAQVVALNLLPLVQQARILGFQFDAVVANPPYMGNKGMNARLSAWAKNNYPDSKSDLFAMFIERNIELTRNGGFVAMITMQSWMFLSSYSALREKLFDTNWLVQMFHTGPGLFPDMGAFNVLTTNFIICKSCCNSVGVTRFIKANDTPNYEEKIDLLRNHASHIFVSITNLKSVPGFPLIYWLGSSALSNFERLNLLNDICPPKQGLATGENAKFVRFWHEVDLNTMGLNFLNSIQAKFSGRKWFPYNKGGNYRKWYGNNDSVINWEHDGQRIKEFSRAVIRNPDYYFREGIVYSLFGFENFGVRYKSTGFIFDVSGSSIFPVQDLEIVLAFLCSNVAFYYLRALAPTVNFQVGDLARLPLPNLSNEDRVKVIELAKLNIKLCRSDWDSVETSWDFETSPLVRLSDCSFPNAFNAYLQHCDTQRNALRENEQFINTIMIASYHLESEVVPNVNDRDLSIKKKDPTEIIEEFISYAIGCMMGRYSLDDPGLIYAHAGNVGFDPDRYHTFPADADGIVPITDELWFEDDAANRLNEFLLAVWDAETLEENRAWLAESLGRKGNETSQETIRRYIAGSFYKNHLQTYKKRPIYWLFSSGKQGAFQALVYLHRYNESTLARMRAEYVVPLTGKIQSRIDMLKKDADAATSNAEKSKLGKDIDKLGKKYVELLSFDEKLRHYADLRIQLDLDDGVKVNYGKFGDLLAEVKAVTGGKDE
ncbi:MAG: BREX-1 system adenine-specific DNA-methyltransferase PglX [Methylococcales bacterium]|nr:BREX-1 system adenine-specific DNA-methyltransferase PglX [Methylococcales bacterium]MDD5632039.1 BREX-1 system adenine-specific DNA-methyltransferase PglX [Methylococcales bacterium]